MKKYLIIWNLLIYHKSITLEQYSLIKELIDAKMIDFKKESAIYAKILYSYYSDLKTFNPISQLNNLLVLSDKEDINTLYKLLPNDTTSETIVKILSLDNGNLHQFTIKI